MKILKSTISGALGTGLCLVAGMSMHSGVAVADAPSLPASLGTEAHESMNQETSVDEANIRQEPQRFISDGSPVFFEDLGMSFTPLAGWEVIKGSGNISLIMQEKEPTKMRINGEQTKYQRNLTLVTKHRPLPIDEVAAEEFRKEITERMTKDSLVSEFQIIEHRFINYRKEKDAILVYSAMKLGSYMMMQAHLIVSGEQNHFTVSYTDLAERFTADQETFQMIWSTMNSIQVTGEAQMRHLDLIISGSAAAGLLTLMLLGGMLRKRRASRLYAAEANTVYDEDSTSSIEAMGGSDSNSINDKDYSPGSGAMPISDGMWNLSDASYSAVEEISRVSNYS